LIRRVIFILTCLLAFIAAHASAQVTETKVYTGGPATVYWDPVTSTSPLPEDAVVRYELDSSGTLQTGNGNEVFLKNWFTATGSGATSFTIPTVEVPARPFYLSVRAVTASGAKSQHSNTLLFKDPGIPPAPTKLRTTPVAP
jgi:hypothetical protein